MLDNHTIPLSLYIHFPWCQQKCPYCDFNSHAIREPIPEQAYMAALLRDLDLHMDAIDGRPIHSLFLGGGTPSLFSPKSMSIFINKLKSILNIDNKTEITMEANPGTVESSQYAQFAEAGINRLSIGIQSFHDPHLTALGRIHNSAQAQKAFETAKNAGFDSINLDLMFGLPKQTMDEALQDIKQAILLQPDHISWYQLTLEPNTYFHRFPPQLPTEDSIWDMQLAGQKHLKKAGYIQYEVSAYSILHKECRHNVNYWQYGDYLGIGAGAHGKITQPDGKIVRYHNLKHPKIYLATSNPIESKQWVKSADEMTLEFMLNALRLKKPIKLALYEQRTGLRAKNIKDRLNQLVQRELIEDVTDQIKLTSLGSRFLNEVITAFLPH